MYLSAVSRSALGYSFQKHKTRIDADHGAMACNIHQLVVVGFRACAGKAEIQSEDMQFADYLLGSLGRGCRSCIDLQEAAHAMVLESGGSCSSVTRKISQIGACGRHPQNAERDLFRLLSLPCDSFL